ncbi:hypothetical protein RIR_jg20167.t1 [Rhizophagus irregularis DAOM 181602=DAOM 197198]|nr:hypothetical protein RIR_jg20167.t1 [Rhizophagus irregularis DAOM 181602=DAOM 197198]
MLSWFSSNNSNKLYHRCGKLSCAPNFCSLKQSKGRTRTRDLVAKLKKRFNINQSRHSNSNANLHSRSQSHSKSRDQSASTLRRDNNNTKINSNNTNNQIITNANTSHHARRNSKEHSVSFSSSSHSIACPLPRQTPNSALSPDNANNILNGSTFYENYNNSRVVIESKLDLLTGSIHKFISSISGTTSGQTDSASSV